MNCNFGLQRARLKLALVSVLRQAEYGNVIQASRKGFPAGATLRSAWPDQQHHAHDCFVIFAMIGEQIRFFRRTPWASAGGISSSGQHRHPAAACATCEVIAKSRRRTGTRVDTEQRSLV